MVAQQWRAIPPIPRETQRRARAVFGSSNFYVRLGDQLQATLDGLQPGILLDEIQNVHGPVPVPALVTFFQVVEELSDTQAGDALRTRLDWQYALHLSPTYPGLRQDELCAYRQRLIAGPHRRHEFQKLADRLAAMRPFRGVQTACSGQFDVLTAVCFLNRLRWTLEAIHTLLWALASRWPDLLSTITLPHWYTTYWAAETLFPTCICCVQEEEVEALGRRLGADVRHLLDAVARCQKPEVQQANEVQALERIWRQQFKRDARGEIALRQHCSFCSQAPAAREKEGA